MRNIFSVSFNFPIAVKLHYMILILKAGYLANF